MAQDREIQRRNNQEPASPALRSPLSRFFDEAFWDPFRLIESPLMQVTDTSRQFAPLVDVSETDKEVIIEADIPNVNPKNIKVDVTNNMLTISGQQEEQTGVEDRKWHRRERSYSYAEFTRQILLPDYADGTKADCKVRHGILEIHIPKKQEAEPKHLDVKVES
ncbi:MAG: Heat shock protein Hsp20 family [Candidatus Peribacteria bacterium]|nr:Heat shock protein Hsp20 family [Candidatus Peribacteria bacterium]